MKKIMGILIGVTIAASSLMSWEYYQRDYDNYYPYSEIWQYSDYEDCSPSVSQQKVPVRKLPQYSEQAQQSGGALEQKYPNLVVMFTKNACPYCVFMKPIMKQAEMKFGKDIKFIYVDIVQHPQTPSQYGFSTVPHIMYFKNGKKLGSHGSGNGTMTVEKVEDKLEAYFSIDSSEE